MRTSDSPKALADCTQDKGLPERGFRLVARRDDLPVGLAAVKGTCRTRHSRLALIVVACYYFEKQNRILCTSLETAKVGYLGKRTQTN